MLRRRRYSHWTFRFLRWWGTAKFFQSYTNKFLLLTITFKAFMKEVWHTFFPQVHHLLTTRATPVQFRTSPPLEAVKPERRSVACNKTRTASPPPKLLHYEVSPRKRTKHARHAHIQRPYLDFEKMQQVRLHFNFTKKY